MLTDIIVVFVIIRIYQQIYQIIMPEFKFNRQARICTITWFDKWRNYSSVTYQKRGFFNFFSVCVRQHYKQLLARQVVIVNLRFSIVFGFFYIFFWFKNYLCPQFKIVSLIILKNVIIPLHEIYRLHIEKQIFQAIFVKILFYAEQNFILACKRLIL